MSESRHPRGPIIFRCFDLETTGVDVETCEVVQAAVVLAPELPPHQQIAGLKPCLAGVYVNGAESHSQIFAARDVPPESTAVHRITDRDPERFPYSVPS